MHQMYSSSVSPFQAYTAKRKMMTWSKAWAKAQFTKYKLIVQNGPIANTLAPKSKARQISRHNLCHLIQINYTSVWGALEDICIATKWQPKLHLWKQSGDLYRLVQDMYCHSSSSWLLPLFFIHLWDAGFTGRDMWLETGNHSITAVWLKSSQITQTFEIWNKIHSYAAHMGKKINVNILKKLSFSYSILWSNNMRICAVLSLLGTSLLCHALSTPKMSEFRVQHCHAHPQGIFSDMLHCRELQ